MFSLHADLRTLFPVFVRGGAETGCVQSAGTAQEPDFENDDPDTVNILNPLNGA
ncbi:hypothetical protein GCM10027256_33180 [Novispirillum itersonii subsp. nipponicum]